MQHIVVGQKLCVSWLLAYGFAIRSEKCKYLNIRLHSMSLDSNGQLQISKSGSKMGPSYANAPLFYWERDFSEPASFYAFHMLIYWVLSWKICLVVTYIGDFHMIKVVNSALNG